MVGACRFSSRRGGRWGEPTTRREWVRWSLAVFKWAGWWEDAIVSMTSAMHCVCLCYWGKLYYHHDLQCDNSYNAPMACYFKIQMAVHYSSCRVFTLNAYYTKSKLNGNVM